MEVKMQRISITLQDFLLRRINEVAREMGVSRSVAIRLLLMAGIGDWSFEKWREKKRKEVSGNATED